MRIETGRFEKPATHHAGWLRVFRGRGIAEMWFGRRYVTLEWRR